MDSYLRRIFLAVLDSELRVIEAKGRFGAPLLRPDWKNFRAIWKTHS